MALCVNTPTNDGIQGILEPSLSSSGILREDHDVDKIVLAAVFTGVLPEAEARRSRSVVDINVMGTTNLLELARILPEARLHLECQSSILEPGYARGALY